ncbi:MAG: glycosyltransferase family 4 protein [Clostridia bacterium]|nr:glycosyltransferase family 4 protein [Clostridia bacterium]
MVKYVDIIYHGYLDENMNRTIGGVQTYITDLVKVFENAGLVVRVIQFSKADFVCDLSDNSQVIGFCVNKKSPKKRYQEIYNRSIRTAKNVDETLTIFATDIMIPRKVLTKSVAIQHGIFWDIPKKKKRWNLKRIVARVHHSESLINRIKKVDGLICVDYNFLNWYRTQVDVVENEISVIPNYTALSLECNKSDGITSIIFARRLYEYRGTKVFANVAKMLLDKYSNIHITIAGSGPDETWMKEKLRAYNNVLFTKYASEDSLKIHADKHIAVIPTVGSEGTSLSLLEAMASNCAVICTNVGGMTNIVLNGYNGLIVDAGNEQQLYDAMCSLIENPDKSKRLASKARETVEHSFSQDVWAKSWVEFVKRF